MSKFSQEEQANIVGMAARLEAAILTENEEIAKLQSQQFKSQPEVPTIEHIPEPQYERPKNPEAYFSSFGRWLGIGKLITLLAFMAVSFIVGFIILCSMSMDPDLTALFVFFYLLTWIPWVTFIVLRIIYKMKRKAFSDIKYKEICHEIALRNQKMSEEYKAKCEAARAEFEASKVNYENVVVPAYKNELVVWQGNQSAKLAVVQNDLKENIEALQTLYSTTQIVPSSYRTADRLTWLYEDMSTSEHDIERSIDLLNSKEIKEELINIQYHVDDIRRDIREGFIGVYTAIQEGNEIQSEMLMDLDRIRKSAKFGNFLNVGNLLQNHNRNKMISQITGNR